MFNSREEMNQATMQLLAEHRPYMQLCQDLHMRASTATEYLEAAMKLVTTAEDPGDLESAFELMLKCSKKTTLMAQLLQEQLNYIELSPEPSSSSF